jgi:ubiquinone/menaquinone biosynthesis C-methylase UbiE
MRCAVNSAEQPYHDATLSMARQSPRSESVLDVGCGRNPYFFYSRFKNYVGIDINAATLKEVSSNLPEANLIRASGFHAPFKERVFDLVICTEVLEHLKSPEKMVAEIRRKNVFTR